VTAQFTHTDDDRLNRHIANAKRKETRSGVVIRKDRPQSPRKIDLAVCAVLAYEARGDVIQSGVVKKKKTIVAGF
jgi:phage terminase large subunit-like protein